VSPSPFPATPPLTGTRRWRHRLILILIAIFIFTGFCTLGTWQLHRRIEKQAKIRHVEQRIHAPAVPAPGTMQWQQIHAKTDEYRHVVLTGRFLYRQETLVQANTQLGSGYWVMTPLRRHDGTIILINRGFVPSDQRARIAPSLTATAAQTDVSVTGLLRLSEPNGAFLRKNNARHNRWYSRDVQAIAATQGLNNVAPYFVDAAGDANAIPNTWPKGGMTVVVFPDHHLIYAITWYILALMTAGAGYYALYSTFKYGD
jgi:surfeit locus 1 family protein